MMKDLKTIEELYVIPEEAVYSAAYYMGGEENNFTKILDKVKAFKEAEMTPIILMDRYDATVYVVAAETFQKKLH